MAKVQEGLSDQFFVKDQGRVILDPAFFYRFSEAGNYAGVLIILFAPHRPFPFITHTIPSNFKRRNGGVNQFASRREPAGGGFKFIILPGLRGNDGKPKLP
jgi:hypothetical protein